MIISENNNTARCRCNVPGCGNEFDVNLPAAGELFADTVRGLAGTVNCESCIRKIEKDRDNLINSAFLLSMPERLAASGIPEDMQQIDIVPNRELAKMIWTHRQSHLVVSGVTGAGKTTSVAKCATELIKQGKKVQYITARRLFASYSKNKSGNNYDPNTWFSKIFKADYLIIDELVGKSKLSETGAECLFEIIDSAYGGKKTRIWLMGNFYAGSIEAMLSDAETAETVLRRLREKFVMLLAEKTDGVYRATVKSI